MPDTHDFANLDNLGESATENAPMRDVTPSASQSKKDQLFESPEAIAFEKQTVADFDNVNIDRSRAVEDEVVPDVPSFFPSTEETTGMKELEEGGDYH
jgi:hypothetical protein